MSELVRNRSAPSSCPQLEVVVDLAVVRDPVFRSVGHRLLARDEVDDRKTPMRECHGVVRVNPCSLPVRSTVGEQGVHEPDYAVGTAQRRAAERNGTTYTAHQDTLCGLIAPDRIRVRTARGRLPAPRTAEPSADIQIARFIACISVKRGSERCCDVVWVVAGEPAERCEVSHSRLEVQRSSKAPRIGACASAATAVWSR